MNKAKKKAPESGHFKVGEKYESDRKKMSDANKSISRESLQKDRENMEPEIVSQGDENATKDVDVTENDMMTTVDQLKENSAPGPDGVPDIFLKK